MGQDLDTRLGELAALCKRQRQGTRKPRYDEKTKSLVRELMAGGLEAAAVARAAGVSISAIRTWLMGPAMPSPARQRPVKILSVVGSGGATDQGHMVMMIRVADFDVAIYRRDGGRS